MRGAVLRNLRRSKANISETAFQVLTVLCYFIKTTSFHLLSIHSSRERAWIFYARHFASNLDRSEFLTDLSSRKSEECRYLDFSVSWPQVDFSLAALSVSLCSFSFWAPGILDGEKYLDNALPIPWLRWWDSPGIGLPWTRMFENLVCCWGHCRCTECR